MIDARVVAGHRSPTRDGLDRASRTRATAGSSSRPRLPVLALLISAGIDGAALAVAVLAPPTLPLLLVATVLHGLAAASVLLIRKRLPGSWCMLAMALILTMPVVGVLLVALALGTAPQGALGDSAPADEDQRALPDPRRLRHIAAALPACEVLMAAAIEDRRATLAALARRGDANAVSVLRWVISTGGEMAVEGALALDELGTGFEYALTCLRDEMADAPTVAAAMAGATLIARALESGIVEATMVETLATEARGFFVSAAAHAPPAGTVAADTSRATLARARLELAALQPAAALAILDQALATGATAPELLALRAEAQLLAHAGPATRIPVSMEGAHHVGR